METDGLIFNFVTLMDMGPLCIISPSQTWLRLRKYYTQYFLMSNAVKNGSVSILGFSMVVSYFKMKEIIDFAQKKKGNFFQNLTKVKKIQ